MGRHSGASVPTDRDITTLVRELAAELAGTSYFGSPGVRESGSPEVWRRGGRIISQRGQIRPPDIAGMSFESRSKPDSVTA